MGAPWTSAIRDFRHATRGGSTGGLVRLEFTPPLGDVEVLAMVRQRTAFRYGFQFIDAGSARDVIAGTCRKLSVEQFAGRLENDLKH
jgi:hypothetical protein